MAQMDRSEVSTWRTKRGIKQKLPGRTDVLGNCCQGAGDGAEQKAVLVTLPHTLQLTWLSCWESDSKITFDLLNTIRAERDKIMLEASGYTGRVYKGRGKP